SAEGLLLVARNQLDRGRIDVARALGLDAATPLALTDSLAPSLGAADVPAQRDSAVTAALANRPELRAELARAAAARQTGSAIRAERLPRLQLAGDYGVNGMTVPGAISTRDLTLQVSLPILDGFRREARLAEQDAVVRESQVREADLRRQIAAEVDAALLDLGSAQAQQAVAREQLRLAESELSQSRERFKAGVAGNIDVITAQAGLIRARDTEIEARFAAAAARISLARAAGVARTLHERPHQMSDDMATTIERETAQRSARPSPVSPEQPADPAKPSGRKRTVFIIMGVVLLGLVAVGARRWIYSLSHVSTDNAQVDGHIVPILPKVGGYVLEVRTDENRPAKAGDTLVVLDDRDYKARLAQAEADLAVALAGVSNRERVGQAEAQVAQAQANAEKAHADLERTKPLAEKDIVPKQAHHAAEAAARAADAGLAAAQAALLGADARVAAARAARDQAALNLSYTRIIAPSEGVVSKKTVEIGQLVQPGQPLMSEVPLSDVWVTANLKETQTADVKPGDPVDFTVDAYGGRHFSGHVESLAPATGARFSLLPPDNATGNFTKVVQRIPVRIRLDGKNDPARPLRPGMSANVTITT